MWSKFYDGKSTYRSSRWKTAWKGHGVDFFFHHAFDCFSFLSQSVAWFEVKSGTPLPPFLVTKDELELVPNPDLYCNFPLRLGYAKTLSNGSSLANLSLSVEQEAQGLRFSLCKVFPPHPAIYHNLKALLNFHSNHASIVFISSWNVACALRMCVKERSIWYYVEGMGYFRSKGVRSYAWMECKERKHDSLGIHSLVGMDLYFPS